MFLEQQISILEWFLKIMWHWRLEKWCWKFSFAITGINIINEYIYKQIHNKYATWIIGLRSYQWQISFDYFQSALLEGLNFSCNQKQSAWLLCYMDVVQHVSQYWHISPQYQNIWSPLCLPLFHALSKWKIQIVVLILKLLNMPYNLWL